MLLRILLLFTIIPIVELYLLIRIGRLIGAFETVGLVLLIGLVGAWLARREGLRTIRAMQSELRAGHLPGDQLIDGMLIFAAGVLLITPGVLTDLLGLSLLLPPVRGAFRTALKRRFQSHFVVFRAGQGDDFIDIQPNSAYDRRDDGQRLE